MVLLKHFQLKNQKQPLPDPNGALSIKIPCSAISYADVCVGKLLNSRPIPIPLMIVVTSIIITQGAIHDFNASSEV